MLQPAELKSDQPLTWSPGRGTDVWALFQACAGGDLQRSARSSRKTRHWRDRTTTIASRSISRCARTASKSRGSCSITTPTRSISGLTTSPIEIARDRGYAAMERVLVDTLETTFNASEKGEPVALALRKHQLKKMRELLDAEPELVSKGDKRSNQPIHWATMTGSRKPSTNCCGAARTSTPAGWTAPGPFI